MDSRRVLVCLPFCILFPLFSDKSSVVKLLEIARVAFGKELFGYYQIQERRFLFCDLSPKSPSQVGAIRRWERRADLVTNVSVLEKLYESVFDKENYFWRQMELQ